MPVVAIVNRKGGSGKSTLATQLAGHLAGRGTPVMLGDVDRQQSTMAWLRRRADHDLPAAPIVGWTVDARNVLRPPPGVAHVVLDTPGGLQGLELGRLLLFADAVVLPVCDSPFDRDAAAACLAELRAHPRVAAGKVTIAAVGMRIDTRTRAEQTLRTWATAHELRFLGVLRSAQVYVRCAETGLTIFDLPEAKTQTDREQWRALIDGLAPVLDAGPAMPATRAPRLVENPTPRLVPAVATATRAPTSTHVASVRPASVASTGWSAARAPLLHAPAAGTLRAEGESGGWRRVLAWLAPRERSALPGGRV